VTGRRLSLVSIAVGALACGSPEGPSATLAVRVAPEGLAILDVTRMTFTAEAAGLAGEPTFTWDFGDGSTAHGRSVSRVFRKSGEHQVTLVAVQGSRRMTASVPMLVRSLDGNWQRSEGSGPAGFPFHFPLVQRGNVLTGEINSPSLCPTWPPPHGTIRGTVSHPRSVQWTLSCVGVREFTGEVNTELDAITGGFLPNERLTYLRLR
jgi:hypothetical protein